MKKGITIVYFANIINMLFSIITSFILPKYLSIESYGYYKIFQLYVNYLGIIHLGYIDGIYLRYGGKDLKQIDSSELLRSSATIRNLQLIFTVLLVATAIALKNPIGIMLALSCVPVNMVSFYKCLYQATGEFKDYGIILTVIPMLMFFANLVLLFIFKTDNFVAYVAVVFFSYLFLYLFLEYKNSKLFGKIKLFSFDVKQLKENISSGITLTIGNFASILITSIDRWFIQLLMGISDFSYYSFAVSVENLFNVCVSAVTTTLYNYLCKVKDINVIVRIKTYCTFVGIYLVAIAFPVKFIIQFFINKYSSSVICLFVLICAHSYYFVIKAIYVNLYKARGQQKHYLYQMIIVLGITIATNLTGYFGFSKTKEAFAFATLMTAVIWYYICYCEFKDIRGSKKEPLLMIACSIVFLMTGILINNAIVGGLLYIAIVTALAFALSPRKLEELLSMGLGYLKIIGGKMKD